MQGFVNRLKQTKQNPHKDEGRVKEEPHNTSENNSFFIIAKNACVQDIS